MSSVGEIVEEMDGCRHALHAAGAALAGARFHAEDVHAGASAMGLEGSAAAAAAVLELIGRLISHLDELTADAERLRHHAEAAAHGPGGIGAGIGVAQPWMELAGTGQSRRVERGGTRFTEPSRSPNPAAVPLGQPETAPRARRLKQEALKMQRETAECLARAGYRVRQLPAEGRRPTPDFEVEGFEFDCYAPGRGTPLDSIRTALRDKIKKQQAVRFIVNLDRSPWSADDLGRHLARSHPSALEEVLAVKGSIVKRVFP